jgi:uncharacterized protein YlbG (UPF0298 family)
MIIILIIWTVGIFAVSHYIKHRRYHKSDVKFFRIYSGVHDLAQIVNQLQELEELQTQIELARFHHLKGVTVSLPDNLSHNHEHTLLINGHDRNSKALMQLVLDERDRLRETLEKKIKELAKHGTTQLRPDLALKEIAECSTMRVRGAHFSPIETTSPPDAEITEDRNNVIKTDDFNIFFAGENSMEGGEDE